MIVLAAPKLVPALLPPPSMTYARAQRTIDVAISIQRMEHAIIEHVTANDWSCAIAVDRVLYL